MEQVKVKNWKVVLFIMSVVGSIIIAAVWKNRKRVFEKMDAANKFSENFSLSEFVKTSVTGYDNIPGPEETENLRALVVNILQPLRTYLGKPVTVTSGYRSWFVNMAVGGAGNSQHLKGEAADIQVEGMTNQQIIDVMRRLGLPYDQVIDEESGNSKWVHVTFKRTGGNRGNWLTYRNGKYELISTNYA